jgi:hypothetical protein
MTVYNVGFDFSFTNRKLYGTAEYFYRDRKGIPATRITSLPSTFGATLPQENLNHISNRGIELSLGKVQNAGDFSMDITGNISWSRARYEYFEEPEFDDPDQERIERRTGKWTDATFGYKTDGLFTTQEQIDSYGVDYSEVFTAGNSALRPGDVKFLDTNNDGKLNWRDRQEIGSGTMPHWMYGLNAMMKYKNFDFTAFFQGAFGYSTDLVGLVTSWKNAAQYELRWTESNNDAKALRPRFGGASINTMRSDHFYRQTSYVRLKNASLGYEVPKHILSKVGIVKLRIYLAGTNLFTISNLNKFGIDPEAPQMLSYYPQQRTYSIGVNLSF